MASLCALLFFASTCAGFIVPMVENHRSGHLAARAPQQAQNLDNEPVFTDHNTKTTITKSLILTGLGPDPATNRWYDWDETCTDPKDRALIAATFDSLLKLTAQTSQHLVDLKAGFPNPVNPNAQKDDPGNRAYILKTDPAYTQMFNAIERQIDYVIGTFNLITEEGQKPPTDRNGNKAGALRFICDRDGVVKNNAGQPCCGTGQAVTSVPFNPKREDLQTIEAKFSFETSSSITFCPPFFDENQFPNLEAVIARGDETLDKIDCRERILLHEYTHLPWIRNFHGRPDYTGWKESAKYATKTWRYFKTNPDNYAWLALYAWFNNHKKGCGGDAWPSGVAKYTKS